jgi:Glycosyltransferase family 87
LASGSWLTSARVRRIAGLAGLATMLTLSWLFLSSTGTVDWMGRPLGTDFSNVWTAGWMALHGRASEVWSWQAHFQVQQALHGNPTVDLFGWHYPPPFLLIAAGLATLPYVHALILWQLATLIPFAWLMQRLIPGWDALLLTLAAPVVLICLTHGHNGFLTAFLLAGGLMQLERRSLLAGILFGCLIYKPQFALVLPVLLLAGRHWRAIAGAALSAGILVGITLIAWGWPVWQAFLDSLPLTRSVVIEQGATGFHKIMSPFAAVRMWGGEVSTAYAVQLVFTVAAMAVVGWVSFASERKVLRNALVCAAVVISTPYVLDYDLVVLLPALAWLWLDGREHGFQHWDRTLMGLVWIAPLFARSIAEFALVPLGMMTGVIVAAIALRRVTASPFRHLRAASAQ